MTSARVAVLIAWIMVATAISGVSATQDPWGWVPAFVEAANSWREGQPIPGQLLHYKQTQSDLPDSTDSRELIFQVTNLGLLAALVLDPSAAPECREDAFQQGMYASGPTAFFKILREKLDQIGISADPWSAEIRQRIARPHVVVDALSIADRDMMDRRAEVILDEISGELRAGGKWGDVYTKYANRPDIIGLRHIRIINAGHFVVFEDSALGGHFTHIGPHTSSWEGPELPRRLSRLAFFDSKHVQKILRASAGDIVRLHSKDYHEYVLYQVKEVYPGSH